MRARINFDSYEVGPVTGHITFNKPHMFFLFPNQKKLIARLSYDEKMEWYAYQFEKSKGIIPFELTSPEFQRFWKWRVLIPMKLKRLFYRIKNGEIFKTYPHISQMKEKVKKHGI